MNDMSGKTLTTLPGVGPKLSEKIQNYYRRSYELYRRLGKNYDSLPFESIKSIDRLTEGMIYKCISISPYDTMNVPGISWKRADEIAAFLGVEKGDPKRHFFGNREILRVPAVLPVTKFYTERKSKSYGLLEPEHKDLGVSIEDGLAWHPQELLAEKELAAAIVEATSQSADYGELTENELGYLQLNRQQATAVESALGRNPIVALTGGAGTGKTYTVASLAKIAQGRGLKFSVMALSGKAAVRASEMLREQGVYGVPTSTIHRAEARRGNPNEESPFDADIIVLDEASMLDNRLVHTVLHNKKKGSKVVMVGDPEQLPPIGYGSPFRDAIKAGIPLTTLSQNYRSAGQQAIYDFGQAVRGNVSKSELKGDPAVEFRFNYDLSGSEGQLQSFYDLILEVHQREGLSGWQVITWRNRDRHILNELLKNQVNRFGAKAFKYRRWDLQGLEYQEVHSGDKVVVKTNAYNYGRDFNGDPFSIFNGETAIVTECDDYYVYLDFGDGEKKPITVSDAPDLLELGFAITAHKSQGSDWGTVIVYQDSPILFEPRQWWYTAVTRAKRKLVIVSEMTQAAFWSNVERKSWDKPTTLTKRIQELRESGV